MWISSQRSRSGSRGFTLIELLAVISIMTVLTTIFLIRQKTFNSATLLRSLAYSVGLSVRQAQVYGTSVRDSSGTGTFAAKGYGIYFTSATPNTYILFADKNNDGAYNAGEDVQAFTINQGYSISKFCATAGGVAQCTDSGTPLTQMTVVFRRPNPDSCFATNINPNACAIGASPVYSSGYVQLRSGTDTRSVTITLTGQISVGAKGT